MHVTVRFWCRYPVRDVVEQLDYVVTHSKGNVSNLSDQCWTVLSAIAYAEDRQGDRFTNAFAAHSADWIEFLECQIAGVR